MPPNALPKAMSPATFRGAITVPYLIAFPDEYFTDPTHSAEGGRGWPLVLFLHGAGERGNDLGRVLIHGPPKQIAAGRTFPFVLVAPQCDEDSWWEPGDLKLLVESIQQAHSIDVDRTYCTGISMGGFGTWELVLRFPNLFAAAAPICGGGDPFLLGLQSQRNAQLSIWAFHGDADLVVPVERSGKMVEAFKTLPTAEVKFTVYPGVAHDSWTQTYDDPALYDWLLRQRRVKRP